MIDIVTFSAAGHNKVNEDYTRHAQISPGIWTVAVADGMGGLSCGFAAARIAVNSSLGYISENYTGESNATTIRDSMVFANDEMRVECINRKAKIGAALAIVMITADSMTFASMGNVRIYLLRNGKLRLLTIDHTVIYNGHSYLTQCVNGRCFKNVPIVRTIPLYSGDQIFVATDGFYENQSDMSQPTCGGVGDDDSTFVRISVG